MSIAAKNLAAKNPMYGWEMVTTEDDFVEAKKRLKEYKENEPNISFRIKKVKQSED